MKKTSTPAISITHAELSYNQRPLFQSIQAQFPAQSWTCLLGRSGCGKSTLLRMIANLALPDNHSITLTISDNQPLEGRIAWMAQQDLLVPWFRVIDNVMLRSKWQGKSISSDVKARAQALLKRVGLEAYAHAWPSQLSGGQRQRVALARTLFEEATVVLMDEPFSAVDAITRVELHALACELLKDCTVIMVTHDPQEALRLADQILILHGEPATLHSLSMPASHAPRKLSEDDLSLKQEELMSWLVGNQQGALQDA